MNTVSTEGKLAQNKLCNVQHRDNFIYGYFINFDASCEGKNKICYFWNNGVVSTELKRKTGLLDVRI